MMIAVAGALALGEWFEAATVVWLLAWRSGSKSGSRTRASCDPIAHVLAPASAAVRRRG